MTTNEITLKSREMLLMLLEKGMDRELALEIICIWIEVELKKGQGK